MDEITYINAPIIVGLVTISLVLVRLVENLLTRKFSKNNGTSQNPGPPRGGGLSHEEHIALMRLDEAHAKYDSDGTPLWYVPRSWAETQHKITATLEKMTDILNTIAGTQKAIVRTLDRMDDASRRIDIPPRRG